LHAKVIAGYTTPKVLEASKKIYVKPNVANYNFCVQNGTRPYRETLKTSTPVKSWFKSAQMETMASTSAFKSCIQKSIMLEDFVM
jgi:hypothetical protein